MQIFRISQSGDSPLPGRGDGVKPQTTTRASTGVPGPDEVFNGGLPTGRLYLVEGDPGAGKTTIALQFLLEGARAGEPTVYVLLSETA